MTQEDINNPNTIDGLCCGDCDYSTIMIYTPTKCYYYCTLTDRYFMREHKCDCKKMIEEAK